jgi:phosphomethylpyrimidine synthase
MREIALENGQSSIRVYDTSGPQGHDVKQGLPKLREPWVRARLNASPSSSRLVLPSKTHAAPARARARVPPDGLSPSAGCPRFRPRRVARGRAIIPANINHLELRPMIIGAISW